MNALKNEKGVTLVEVIAGVILVSIILISLFIFFNNAANFNAKNDTSIQSATLVREFTTNVNDLYYGLSMQDLQKLHQFNREIDPVTGDVYYKQVVEKDKYEIEIIIYDKKESENSYRVIRTAKITVRENGKDGNLSSQSFTFHEGEVMNP